MSATWMDMVGPADSEPDYYDAIMELESIETMMADVATYDDWFVEEE